MNIHAGLMNTRIVIGNNLDPWRNLAIEEYLLEDVKPKECILYLWQNQKYCRNRKESKRLEGMPNTATGIRGGKLARRSSGGGAVFSYSGNLNFSFWWINATTM